MNLQVRGSVESIATIKHQSQGCPSQGRVDIKAETKTHEDCINKITPTLSRNHDLAQVRAMLGLLASVGQKKLLHGFIMNLDVRILADVVIANLKDLPVSRVIFLLNI